MSKKPAKAAAKTPTAKDASETPTKRSKPKLALFVLAPLLLLGGGGYAGWLFFLAEKPVAQAAHGESMPEGGHGEAKAEGNSDHGTDETIHVSALPPEVLAETSLTHTYALSVLIAAPCGTMQADTLKAAAEKETATDGVLANLSWVAAVRRTAGISGKSCDYIASEIVAAEEKLAKANAPKPEKAGGEHH